LELGCGLPFLAAALSGLGAQADDFAMGEPWIPPEVGIL
jgi:hypothetical protein